jgi:hypothetical protein
MKAEAFRGIQICKRLQEWKMENTCPSLRDGLPADAHRDLQGIWQVAAARHPVTRLTSPVALTR